MRVLDATPCELGEGAFWHPERGVFMWFDIVGKTLFAAEPGGTRRWAMPEMTSAMGWVDRDRLMLSGETSLALFNLETGAREMVAAIAADDHSVRSNDGRADPWGGFWASTMGKQAQPGAGAIWRWWRGELRRLHDAITIPNAICFHDRHAYFADTARRIVWRQGLDAATGWPQGTAEVFLDLSADGLNPDGAVTDAAGNIWIAQWGAGRVACHAPDGRLVRSLPVPAGQCSCPAFGGPALSDLMVTSARQGLGPQALAADPLAGQTFVAAGGVAGVAPPRVTI
ncbi:SMP-30/gluconolactonase/LRE family protein [Paracoccus luteus]|uniref:SMP-30/gluconolactonase/LRE family protein n=1 Tax=Paracoccus luteus TaxID=2508543 RepID=UPI00106F9E30|nr:SMP-30/gluconolactonase/LRE family protein [Paracoccus luteus]